MATKVQLGGSGIHILIRFFFLGQYKNIWGDDK
jgi:hypothetical protein